MAALPGAAAADLYGEVHAIEAPGVRMHSSWQFQPGVSSDSPIYDDSAWLAIDNTILDSMPAGAFNGWGWYRCQLAVDSSVMGTVVGFDVALSGAADFYLNDRPILSFGTVGRSPTEEQLYLQGYGNVHPVLLGADTLQTLTVRFSNQRWAVGDNLDYPGGFQLRIKEFDVDKLGAAGSAMQGVKHQMFLVGMAMAFFLLHLMLYLFYPTLKANLCLAVFVAFSGLISYLPIQMYLVHDPGQFLLLSSLFKITVVGISASGLWFLYSLFYEHPPKHLKILMIPAVLAMLAAPWLGRTAVYAISILLLIEMVRVIVVALRRHRPGASVLLAGMVFFGVASIYQMLMDLRILGNIIEGYYYYHLWGVFAVLLSMSIGLAWRFSQVNVELNRKLEQIEELTARAIGQERRAKQQDIAQKLLEKEITHKKKQLEEAEKLEQALSNLEDVNHNLRDTQSQLVQSEKMASLGMLVAGVAHEINTPVGAIGSMHNTLVRAVEKLRTTLARIHDDSEKADLDKFLGVIDEANCVIKSGTERVTNIVGRLRSFARLDEAELVQADINEGLEDTLTLIHHELKYDIEVDRQYGQIPSIACFAGQLNQVFLNLLVNARQAIKGRGRIVVRTSYEDHHVVIEIKDSGDGVPAEHLERIFDPGFTTKGVGVGTGLGLSICYQIIQAHHGRIGVSSEPGQGTVFTIRIPDNLDVVIGDPKDRSLPGNKTD